MTGSQIFLPKRTPGLVFHSVITILVLGGASFLLFLAFQQSGGINLILFLTGALILLASLPFLVYRGYALFHAGYTLERDGLRIRWGLRLLDIPLSEVEWVRPAEDLQIPVKLPVFSWPGAILGESEHEDLGVVEFIASASDNLVIVAAMDRVVILSPEAREDFILKFNRTLEMGTLAPIQPLSAKPAVFLQSIFKNKAARITIPLGFILWFLLLILVSLLIPGHDQLSMGYDAAGYPIETVPASRLLMLPVIGIFLYAISLIGGAYFFRKTENKPVSQLLWAGGVMTPILLLAAALIFLV
jgi:hypothetical protein